MSVQEFAVNVLELKYQTYSYRVRTGHLVLDDYHRILVSTGKSFEELFPNPFVTRVQEPVRSFQATTIPRAPIKQAKALPSNPEQEKPKKGEAPAPPASSFKPIDVFDGLPPEDDPIE